MKSILKVTFTTILSVLCFSCSDDDNGNNPELCHFENLAIEENAKFPLSHESNTAVWNWNISNDTLRVQTPYLVDGHNIIVQTYSFKITDRCIEPIQCKYVHATDSFDLDIITADFEITVEAFVLANEFKFRVNGFSNILWNGQPDDFFQMSVSPNTLSDIWAMLDSHHTDDVYGGYDSFFALIGD